MMIVNQQCFPHLLRFLTDRVQRRALFILVCHYYNVLVNVKSNLKQIVPLQ